MWDQVAGWLNRKGYLSVREKKFKGTHALSILTKRLAKKELLQQEYPPLWSDFSMEMEDKIIMMIVLGSEKKEKRRKLTPHKN